MAYSIALKLTLQRPQSTGLSQYLAALKRIDYALQNLTSTNLKSNQQAISEFSSLLTFGSQRLQDLFLSKLKENVEPIEPLHYLTKRRCYLVFGYILIMHCTDTSLLKRTCFSLDSRGNNRRACSNCGCHNLCLCATTKTRIRRHRRDHLC